MRLFKQRRPPTGSRPGTLATLDGGSATINVIRYNDAAIETHGDVAMAALDELISDEWTVWIDVIGLETDVLSAMAERFSLHPLLLEDIVNVPQRPKLAEHGDALVLISRMLRYSGETGLDAEQVSMVVVGNVLVTFQERVGDSFEPIRVRLAEDKGPIRGAGADYLLYALVDSVVDAYFPAIESVGDELAILEDAVMDDPTPAVLRRVTNVKSELLAMRRAVWPHRELLANLARGGVESIDESVRVYFRDVHDHAVQTADVIESYRELASGLLNMYLTVVSNKTNDIMKVLTIMASIFIPLTFLAGIYGMNFENMPELHSRWAYPLLLGVMALVTSTMLVFFRRRGWL